MATSKSAPSFLAVVALILVCAAILYLGALALGQFTPKCADNAHCPSFIEMILRAITVFFAGLMVLAGAGWWIVFNILPHFQQNAGPDDRKQEG